MESYRIISDGSCDLPADMAQEQGITVVPFYVSFDMVNYKKEGVEVNVRDFYQEMVDKQGIYPKSSLPSVQDYADVFLPLAKESLLWESAKFCLYAQRRRVPPGSSRKVWWQCENGHAWRAVVNGRTGKQRCGCPFCAGRPLSQCTAILTEQSANRRKAATQSDRDLR